jgi:hypothetical protein
LDVGRLLLFWLLPFQISVFGFSPFTYLPRRSLGEGGSINPELGEKMLAFKDERSPTPR